MQIHYLEIVTQEVDAVCATYTAANDVRFGDPDARLGNARTAALPGGGLVGVRAPMHESNTSFHLTRSLDYKAPRGPLSATVTG